MKCPVCDTELTNAKAEYKAYLVNMAKHLGIPLGPVKFDLR